MRTTPLLLSATGALVFFALAAGSGCGGSTPNRYFDSPDGGGATPGADGGASSGNVGDFGDANAPTCDGLDCQKVSCGSGSTTITGQVFDPAGKNPLYNVQVYIPRAGALAPLPPLSKGVSCDICGSTALNPSASTLTDEDGKFTLKDVPFTTNVPVVIQVGKWRKMAKIDVTNKCADNPIGKLTLPKNGTEGDMPQIAVTTGGCDALECLLQGMGIDDAEFVKGAGGTGHVHLYEGSGGGTGAPSAQQELWNDKTKLSQYDIVALSCECSEHDEEKTNMQAMHDYAEAGGRIFASHYHYTWFKNSPQPDFQGVANWNPNFNISQVEFTVEQGFPKGQSFAKWLVNVGASQTLGKITLNPDDVTDSLSSVNTSTSQSWIDQGSDAVKYFSFNAPISASKDKQCGRAVFGDLHVSSQGGEAFPDGCNPSQGQDLSPQQKALEFLFFDLSSCVQSDSSQPTPVK